jgi:hypothetical protein
MSLGKERTIAMTAINLRHPSEIICRTLLACMICSGISWNGLLIATKTVMHGLHQTDRRGSRRTVLFGCFEVDRGIRFPAGFVHRLGAEVIQPFEFPTLDFASREQFDIDIFEAADQSIKIADGECSVVHGFGSRSGRMQQERRSSHIINGSMIPQLA